jgi:hypothetical protein
VSRAAIDVTFDRGTVRVTGEDGHYEVQFVDTFSATTSDPGDLRKLAKALTQVADFMEADER